ncbi:hypothetical protein SAY86_017108 [Trapa natans]|uniref:EF-hand domain-containing protein n=1 Tax=Trapa natans TaxID=22666 RepID=A0AAN7LQR9_TRANT|nr:hypothetical protein SAY86_017108 [Trapa natans]
MKSSSFFSKASSFLRSHAFPSKLMVLLTLREFSLDYDYLVIAVGAQVNTFNTPGVKENCHFLKGKRRILATDEWLRVKGCENVYAIGDCATIDQRKVMEDIADIFKAADKDNSGTLTVKEFQDVIEDIVIRYPQVDLYLKSKHLRDVTDLLRDPEGHEQKEVDIEGFKFALSHVDSQMKSLPATAQVNSVSSSSSLIKACMKFLSWNIVCITFLLLFNKLQHSSINKFGLLNHSNMVHYFGTDQLY